MAELDPELYTVAWLAPLEIEAQAALHLLDNRHQGKFPMGRGDDHVFQAGDACGHNIIIATIPPGQEYGTGSAAALASEVKRFFPNLWFGLLVGVAAGLPNLSRNPPLDIRLGDVLVGLATGDSAGLITYDLGKETGKDGFQLLHFGHVLANTATVVRSAIGSIKLMAPNDADAFMEYYKRIEHKEHPRGTFVDPGQENDTLYQVDEGGTERLVERERRPASRRTRVWYGPIGSGEKLMKNAKKRDELRDKYDIIGLEMEAAGTMNRIPVGVIRGVCDYGDEHKNKEWQPYAAAMAAAYAKAVLAEIRPKNEIPRAMAMDVRLKRRLDEEYLASIANDRRKRRHDCEVPEDDNPIGLSFDNYGSGTQSSRMEVDNGFKDIDTATPKTGVLVTGVNHSIDASTKKSLIDQLYFFQIDERLMNLTAAKENTCGWFLSKPEYKSWHEVAQQPDHGGFLWINGHPGTGKSTLMKFLFEQAKKSAKGDSLQLTLSFFFLARGTAEEKTTTGLYRSLLHQLFQMASDLQDSLEWMTSNGARVIQRNGWNEEALKQTLQHAVQKLGSRSLTIFVDALDECDQNQVVGMVCFFEELCEYAGEAQVRLRICFSSRHYPSVIIQKGIEVILEYETGHIEGIRQYIKSRLRMRKSKQADSLRSEILEKSSKIFLWVVLVLDILNSEYPNTSVSIQKMRERLKAIPPKLNDLFEMILTRDGENLEQLHVCLKWILFASRPLKPQELYFAIQLSCEKECSGLWDQKDVQLDEMETYVRSSSKGLAEVTRNKASKGSAKVTRNKASKVQFIHESVRDFLLGKYESQWSEISSNFVGHSHQLLRNCCLAQLSSMINQDFSIVDPLPHISQEAQLRNAINTKFPFLEYSILGVFHHANGAQQNGIDQRNFLADFPLQRWIPLNNALEQYHLRRYKESVSPIYIFAENNLADLIRIHPQKASCLDTGDERYGTPIFAALATNSYDAVCEFLKAQAETQPLTSPLHGLCELYCQNRNKPGNLRRDFVFSRHRGILYYLMEQCDEAIILAFLVSDKVETDSQDGAGRTPLSWAAERGHKVIIELLLDKGANVELKDKSNRTPLSWAARRGLRDVVELLLDRGANIESTDSSGRTPLSWAAGEGHMAVVELLLDRGANIESADSSGQTPLSWAGGRGHMAVVELLLDKGANIESTDKLDRTPLSWAAGEGHMVVVELLLDRGANIESTDGSGQTPLSWAGGRGHMAVVELLLDKGANIESTDKLDRTPLSWAAGEGHMVVVELLLDRGANIESTDGSGRTPLLWAAREGHNTVFKLLSAKDGVDINSTDNSGRTPLSWAAERGITAIIELLLVKDGIDLNYKDNLGQTPLSWAAKDGHDHVVKLLLAKDNVDINSKDISGRTPLLWAAETGNKAVAELLLKKDGVDLNCKDDMGRTPLSQAAEKGYTAVIELLLEKDGVDPDCKDNMGRTPLSWAAGMTYYASSNRALPDYQMQLTFLEQQNRKRLMTTDSYDHGAALNLLLMKDGVNKESQDSTGRTPLSWAAGEGCEAAVKLLLQKGANTQAKDKTGRTPLLWAVKGGHVAVVGLLQSNEGKYSYLDYSARALIYDLGT